MKSFILIAVLAALTASSFGASIPAEATQEQAGFEYRQGHARIGDVLLFRTEVRLDPIPNTIQTKIVEYRGDTRVTSLSMLEPGLPQGGHPIVNGFGTNHVTVTITSGLGKGFHYIIEMWGRKN